MDRKRTYIEFAVVILIAALGGLTQTAMNPMLGGVEESFGTPESVSQWLTTAYMLVIGITVPIVTHLTRRFSLRSLIFISVAFMFVGALTAALSPHFIVLFVGRILQAISAGITLPLVQAISMTRFPRGKNATAMGIAGIAMGFAPNIGPLVGGSLIDSLGWRSFFWILAGLMVFFCLLTLLLVKKSEHDSKSAHLDYLSAVLSTLGFGGLLMSFSSMAYQPLTDISIWIELIIGAVCVALFLKRQYSAEHPLIHMEIFRSRTFIVSFITQNLLYACFMGITLIIPLFVINIKLMTPVDAGLVFLPATFLAIVFNPVSGIISDKIGARPVIVVASIALAAGAIPMAFMTSETPFWVIMCLQVVRGAAVSSLIGPINSWGMHKLDMKYMVDGSAFLNAARQACASFGTALMMLLISLVGGALGYELALGLSAAFAVSVVVCAIFFVRDQSS